MSVDISKLQQAEQRALEAKKAADERFATDFANIGQTLAKLKGQRVHITIRSGQRFGAMADLHLGDPLNGPSDNNELTVYVMRACKSYDGRLYLELGTTPSYIGPAGQYYTVLLKDIAQLSVVEES